MTVNWWTIALQTANFLVLVWLLYRLLYKPVRAVIEKRKALAQQAADEAARAKAEAAAAKTRYDEQCQRLARENEEKLRLQHREAEAEREKMLTAARGESERIVRAARSAIEEERAAALKDLGGRAVSLAADLAAGLLSKTVPGQGSDAFLAALEQRLREATPEERERLGRDLAGSGAPLEVLTAAPLAAEERERWRARLARLLDYSGEMRFVADPAILGGAEIRFPHAVLGLTWRDQLESAKRILGHDQAAS